MKNIDQNIFNKNLLLTQNYCQLQLGNAYKNKAAILRSINPTFKEQRLFDYTLVQQGNETKYEFRVKWSANEIDNKDFIPNLFKNQIIFKEVVLKDKALETNCKGKIISVEIDNTITDGAAEFASDGVIDIYDRPPIDTWIYIAESEAGKILYAWIPEQFLHDVTKAIQVQSLNLIKYTIDKNN